MRVWRYNFFIVLVIGLMVSQLANAQVEAKRFVVITFEHSYRWSMHGKQWFHWIMPVDSILSDESAISKVYLGDFSLNNLEDCMNHKPVDPLLIFSDTDFDLGKNHFEALDRLESVVIKGRKKVFQTRLKWASGQRKRVRVYVTPIIGAFCSTEYHPYSQEREGYYGLIYLALNTGFRLDDTFWDDPKSSHVLSRDFSRFDYRAVR